MDSKEKQKAAWLMDALKHVIASMLAASEDDREAIAAKFPKPTGLGTDGTCWSESEHKEYVQAVMRHGARLLANNRIKRRCFDRPS